MDTADRPPRTAAGRRCRRAREVDRPRGSARGDGAGHPEGRPRQVRAREGHPRHHRPQDRRRAAVALDRGGGERWRTRRPRSRVHIAEKFKPDIELGEHHGRPAAADRFRPHRRADRQAGDRAARARIRAQEAVRRVQGPRRRDHQRRGQAHRVRQPDGRARPRRSAAAPRRTDPARELPQRRPGARLHLRRARGAARAADLPVAARIPASWPSCSRRKCRRSTTASSRSRRWRATPAAAPRWR